MFYTFAIEIRWREFSLPSIHGSCCFCYLLFSLFIWCECVAVSVLRTLLPNAPTGIYQQRLSTKKKKK